jgi:hypothetical protein
VQDGLFPWGSHEQMSSMLQQSLCDLLSNTEGAFGAPGEDRV